MSNKTGDGAILGLSMLLAIILLMASCGAEAWGQWEYAGYTWYENPDNGHCYAKTQVDVTWPQAQALAEEVGGHLVTIDDETENNWVLETFAIYETHWWIGLEDVNNDLVYEWVSGSECSYTNWADHHFIMCRHGGQRDPVEYVIQAWYNGLWSDEALQPSGIRMGIIEAECVYGVIPNGEYTWGMMKAGY